jgi:hypothetical protein
MIYSIFLKQMALDWPTTIKHMYISFLEDMISAEDITLIGMQGTWTTCAWNMQA